MKRWEVLQVIQHENGETTLTLRDENGTTKTENYPPGAMVNLIVDEESE